MLEGAGRENENLKGLAGEMGQNGPCHDPCQLSPCSDKQLNRAAGATTLMKVGILKLCLVTFFI